MGEERVKNDSKAGKDISVELECVVDEARPIFEKWNKMFENTWYDMSELGSDLSSLMDKIRPLFERLNEWLDQDDYRVSYGIAKSTYEFGRMM